MNTLTEAARQLGTMFPADAWQPGEAIEIRCLDTSRPNTPPKDQRFFTNHAEALSFALAQRHTWDVFYGVGWRRCPKTGDMKTCRCEKPGASDHVSRLAAVWADLDVPKAGATVEAITETLRAERVAPSLIVGSGRGVHAYWPIEPTADLERVRRINQGLRDRFGGDNAVDPARILRVAGTLHHKQKPARPVRLIQWKPIEVAA